MIQFVIKRKKYSLILIMSYQKGYITANVITEYSTTDENYVIYECIGCNIDIVRLNGLIEVALVMLIIVNDMIKDQIEYYK